ncbi:tRNA (adenosine(37)-N6)-threonylcarbamoyltransferase complex ATPase subunit type 1 TsaE [Hyunsoonleella pacifica]|uniref:tRNA (adenosine(37)-N6)-threonylcarbamoyltransferase complex ATPase subunit type 1 TsaE n=1 Tax=Hyunsoonleella pacifica TaxID=1080224 RepID=UPI0019A4F73E|nr:tRNA (adenosine(37)-N6)-threonylcarbamoyltransferase complex ATPase subunit type 1 TsaE [Hyunsoonleella pacifica]GGD09815.1 tRNA (adenosine(37)-N6)-threonylcarbamoyltransferase complex ATPase subunit type 1 TsaE [Hyunsoonleella pacifica]
MIDLETTYSLNEVDGVAERLIKTVNSKTILLHGKMGVGKTTLVKSIAKALGSADEVSSPTFSIINEYKVDEGLLYHLDLYRIQDIEETYNFGIEEYLYTNHWIVIEWAEIIKPILDYKFCEIFLEENNQNLRTIKVKI